MGENERRGSNAYWKNQHHHGDLIECDLSYSLIFDNIHPTKLRHALSSVGLSELPNRFLLFQVDGYQQQVAAMPITREYYQKVDIIKVIRREMQSLDLVGFVGNLIGEDRFLCFLCCEDWEREDVETLLADAAARLASAVHRKTMYTLSLCISNRCREISDFSHFYPRMVDAIQAGYFGGREFMVFLRDEPSRKEISDGSLQEYYPEVLSAVSQSRPELLEPVLEKLTDDFARMHIPPLRAKLEMIRLMHRIENYCIHEHAPEPQLLCLYEMIAPKILDSCFLQDTFALFRRYCTEASRLLTQFVEQGEQSVAAPISAYIAEHYAQDIHLDEIADILGFSSGHCARLFRKSFGVTFVDYLTSYRVERAKELLLQSRLPIDQIAYAVGFNSYSYFSTCFKRLSGVSPGSYRSKAGK